MQNHNQKVLALFLCLFVFVIYKATVWDPYFGRGSAAKRHEAVQSTGTTVPTTAPAAAPTTTVAASTAPAAPVEAGKTGTPSDGELRAAGEISIETAELKLGLTRLGGRLSEVLLKEYAQERTAGSPALNLVDHTDGAPLPLGVYVDGLDDARVSYQLVNTAALSPVRREENSFYLPPGAKAAFELLGTLPDGREIRKSISVSGEGYLLGVQVHLSQPAAAPVQLEWTKFLPEDAPSLHDSYGVAGYVWFDGQKALREGFSELAAPGLPLGNVNWVAMADKYFMAALLSDIGPAAGGLLKQDSLYGARLSATPNGGTFELFVGPKSYRLLQTLGGELHRAINFGKTGFVSAPLLLLLHFFYGIVGNYGLAIVALTILVKTLLYPLNSASFKQMKAMQDIQPEVQRIRETVKDKQQQQLEMMALYKKRGVNPLGGCLPVLIQMPIFIGLYSALILATELRHAHFAFWINDLSDTERLMLGNFGIPVMVILFVISMLVQQWMTPSTMDPTQKKVMLVMPIVFGFMFANFPAGLTLYWLTNNLISIGQQKALQRPGKRSAFLVTTGVSLGVFALAWLVAELGKA